jgi:hypothetical protein
VKLKLLCRTRTQSAALTAFSEGTGPYVWWGLIVGDWFLGVMWRSCAAAGDDTLP